MIGRRKELKLNLSYTHRKWLFFIGMLLWVRHHGWKVKLYHDVMLLLVYFQAKLYIHINLKYSQAA